MTDLTVYLICVQSNSICSYPNLIHRGRQGLDWHSYDLNQTHPIDSVVSNHLLTSKQGSQERLYSHLKVEQYRIPGNPCMTFTGWSSLFSVHERCLIFLHLPLQMILWLLSFQAIARLIETHCLSSRYFESQNLYE